MQLEDWDQRWQDSKTGWHRLEENQRLVKHFIRGSKRALVPLCGKTLDIIWLAEQGLEVVGAEFSALAIQQFFDDNNLTFEVKKLSEISQLFKCTTVGKNISMYQGDFFAMNDIPALKNFDFIWDRAAMVAINPPDREKYAKKIKSLLVPSGTILLDALVREEGKTGPPHTLTETHIRDAYKPIGFEVNHLEHNEDLSSIDRLGAIQIHTYYIKIM